MFVFAVLLFAQSSYGYRPNSEPTGKIKLTSESRHYNSDHKPDHSHDSSPGPSRYDAGVQYQSTLKEENSEPKYDLYKPHDIPSSYGPSEEDSKYIPHSEAYTKYIIPKKNPSFLGKHTWEEENSHNDKEKSVEIPRYGFKNENHPRHEHKSLGNEGEDLPNRHVQKDWGQKGSEAFQHEPNYRIHPKEDTGDYKHNEKHHKIYPEHKEHHGKHLYPEHNEEHRIGHGKHRYPEHRVEPRIHQRNHHHLHHKKDLRIPPRSHYYPEHKERHNYHHKGHHNPKIEGEKSFHKTFHHAEHKENQELRIPHGSHYHPGHKEQHSYHNKEHHTPKIEGAIPFHKTFHHPEHKKDHETHHESQPLQYQHWSDKGAGSFPKHNTDKWIEELSKVKSHHVPSEPEDISKHKIFHGEPHIEEFIKEHNFNPHKSEANGLHKPPHKEQKSTEHPKSNHPFLKHYPHINKYHKEHHFQPFRNYKPSYNFGGHRHGWIYRPKFDLYQEMRKDLKVKMRLLKEHEQKLAELQKKHLEKYHALFGPQPAKMFLNQEIPKSIFPDFEHKHHSRAEIHEEKDEKPEHTPEHHSRYSDHPKEQDYSSHKPNYPSHYEIPRSHYDAPLPKHEHANHEPKHHDSHHHKHKDDEVP